MRIKRAKQYKRSMAIYRHAFQFKQPYHVLLDGTAVETARQMQLNLEKLIPSTLLADSGTRILITPCIMKELKDLNLMEARRHAKKSFQKHVCKHGAGIPASQCIASLIGQRNKKKYIVMSQDKALRDKLRLIPGVPLLYMNNSVLVMEHPSDATMKAAEKQEFKKLEVDKRELQVIQQKLMEEEEKLIALPAHVEDAQEPRPVGGLPLLLPSTPLKDLLAEPEPIKRRKKPKAPNPLSCLKKKKTDDGKKAVALSIPATPSGTLTGTVQQAETQPTKKKRTRHHRSKKRLTETTEQ